MAENTDEEDLNSKSLPRSENFSDQNNHTINTDTINTNPEIENMEVHKHPHHLTHKKKWGEYLLEFLMLFLAVFLGFLAENKRENIVERHREKDYVISMIEDLQTDTSNLSIVITGFAEMERRFDSTILGFNNGIKTFSEDWTQKFILSFRGGYPDFYQSDRTIQQLKNAGGMRLILNKAGASGIISYDEDVKDLDLEVTSLSRAQDRYIEEVLKVWSINKMYKEAGVTSWAKTRNIIVHNNYWITNDSLAFEHLFNRLSEYSEATVRMGKNFHNLKTKAASLIKGLKKEYRLE